MAEYIKRNAIKARLEDLVDWCQDLRKPERSSGMR